MHRGSPTTRSSSNRVRVITGAPFGGAGDSPLYTDVNAKIAALVVRQARSTSRAPTSCEPPPRQR